MGAGRSLFQRQLLGPWNVNGRRLGLFNRTCLGKFHASGAANRYLCWAWTNQVDQKRHDFCCMGSNHFKTACLVMPWHRNAREGQQRLDELYDRNWEVQIVQKVRCTLGSLSTKCSLPQRSGRSPLGYASLFRVSITGIALRVQVFSLIIHFHFSMS